MRVLEQPRAVGLTLRSYEIDRLAKPRVGRVARAAKVAEGAEHVVVPPHRVRELEPCPVDDLARAPPSHELSFEQVLLAATARRGDARGPARHALVFEQSFE